VQEALPAVFLLGPPHSGKSVLAYSLSQALRRKGVLHYLLRAAPDGEGDWFAEGPRHLVRTLRIKHHYTPEFVELMAQHIRQRRVPLLVDAGGRPTREQIAAIFSQATHGILLLPEGGNRLPWEDILSIYRVPLVADLTSRLQGASRLFSAAGETPLRGVLTGLERGQMARGEVFEALVVRVSSLFALQQDDLRVHHHRSAPGGAVLVDADAWLQRIRPGAWQWHPDDLEPLRRGLPREVPLAFYGRAPVWVMALAAVVSLPAPFYLFDVRYGWVEASRLRAGVGESAWLRLEAKQDRKGWTRVLVQLRAGEIPYAAVLPWPLPLPSTEGVILDGKMPFWLLAGVARFYAAHGKRVAVFQARLGREVPVT